MPDAASTTSGAEREAAVKAALGLYFDGLHYSDTGRLAQVFHREARYVCATEEPLLHLAMPAYFAVVEQRVSPASRGETRHDRIVAMTFAGESTVFVHAECTIGARFFTDFLTLIRTDGRWQIIAKVFHHVPHRQPGLSGLAAPAPN